MIQWGRRTTASAIATIIAAEYAGSMRRARSGRNAPAVSWFLGARAALSAMQYPLMTKNNLDSKPAQIPKWIEYVEEPAVRFPPMVGAVDQNHPQRRKTAPMVQGGVTG